MSKFLIELKNRLSQETPNFQKKLISFGKWLLATGLALIALPAGYEALVPNAGIDLSLLAKIAGHMVLAGLLISAVAGTAVKDPDYSTIDKKNQI